MSWADRRFVIGLLLAGSLVHTAKAETQAEIAARLNEEGKTLMFADPPNYAGATAKFQDAVARVPEAKYFFNLCTSLYQEGKFGFAITACQSVDKNNPDDKLKTKTGKLIDRIRDDAQKQGINLQPEGRAPCPLLSASPSSLRDLCIAPVQSPVQKEPVPKCRAGTGT